MDFPRFCSPALVAMLLVARTATAGGPPAAPQPAPTQAPAPIPADAITDQARELHLKGAELFAKNEFAKAHAAFLAAWALKKHFQIASNLGACEVQLGQYRAAAEHLAYNLREAPKDADPSARKMVEDLYAKATAKIGTVRVTVSEAGAEVRVDGVSVGTSPLLDPLFLDPGSHTIEVKKEGFETGIEKLTTTAGAAEERAVSLRAAANGNGAKSIVPVVGLGAGAGVALGVGIGLMVAWSDRRAQVQSTSEDIKAKGNSCVAGAANLDPRCGALETDSRGAVPLSRAGVGVLIGAGALAAGAAAYWFWPRSPTMGTGMQIVPVASAESGGVLILGSF